MINSGLIEHEAVYPLDCAVWWHLMLPDSSKMRIFMLPTQNIITKTPKAMYFALGSILSVHVS